MNITEIIHQVPEESKVPFMKMTFAYLILAHKNPGQTHRLVKNLLSENASVFIHIDKKEDEELFKKSLSSYSNVFFCNRRIEVNWGGFSIVAATVSLIETMIKYIGIPDYVHLLSGQDFPIRNIGNIEYFFTQNAGRNFIEYDPLPKSDWYLGGMDRIEYKWFIDSIGLEKSRELIKFQNPKNIIPGIKPYGGSAWWSLTGNSVAWLYEQCRDGNEIYDLFKDTLCSDEMLFQTLLMHSPFKDTIINSNLRKIDWFIPGPHPHIWQQNEIDLLKKSPKLWARKFDIYIDNQVLDEIESFISKPNAKNNPSVSVVMSMYNSEKYLKECIESVLGQTFTDFEFIIVDDGSMDSSVQIVERFKDSRIKLIKNKHDYIDSLNKGMSAAKGTYIARMDSDDIMFTERLEIQYDFMISNPDIDVCGSWAECIGMSSGKLTAYTAHIDIVSKLMDNNTIINSSTIIKKSFLDKYSIKYENYQWAEDYKFWLELFKQGAKFATLPRTLIKYRNSPTQVTNTNGNKMRESAFKIQIEFAEYIANKIADENKEISSFLENIFNLTDEGVMRLSMFKQIINVLYIHYHIMKNT